MAQEVSVAKTLYEHCLATMFGLRRFGIKLGLETIETILSALGDPQHSYRSIHIAGTNGKGSVATMLSTILMAAGYRVGRYTSPHLESFNERICIDNVPIEDDAVVSAHDRVHAVQNLKRQPTFFEFTTAMALDEFGRRKVDWAMIETGMGGRLDATNTIHPVVSVITNISLEHKAYLGNTIAAIAGEKAGIIKAGIPVVTGVTQSSARARIDYNADRHLAPVYLKGRDFRCRRTPDESFAYYGMDHTWSHLQLSLNGSHQVDNASLVLAVCEILQSSGQARIPLEAIRSGLENSSWPGRLEVAHDAPRLILDGAHNLMAARVLARHLGECYKNRNITLVVGVLDDKPCESILRDLAGPCRRAIVTQPEINRAVPAERLAATARKYFTDVVVVPEVHKAVRQAIQDSHPDDVVCVAGSLYVVGEAKTALRRMGLGK
jgi:dihydrofolate synthase / folylpolyglutamate synthase